MSTVHLLRSNSRKRSGQCRRYSSGSTGVTRSCWERHHLIISIFTTEGSLLPSILTYSFNLSLSQTFLLPFSYSYYYCVLSPLSSRRGNLDVSTLWETFLSLKSGRLLWGGLRGPCDPSVTPLSLDIWWGPFITQNVQLPLHSRHRTRGPTPSQPPPVGRFYICVYSRVQKTKRTEVRVYY